jgi:hypothetical protein
VCCVLMKILTGEWMTREDWHNDPKYGTEESSSIVALSTKYGIHYVYGANV